MATDAHQPARFQLPRRVRIGPKSTIELVTKTHLIDRIADLPGIETVKDRDGVMPCSVDLYLKNDNLQNPTRVRSPLYFANQRACDKHFNPSASAIGAQRVSIWDLPKFSRKTLQ